MIIQRLVIQGIVDRAGNIVRSRPIGAFKVISNTRTVLTIELTNPNVNTARAFVLATPWNDNAIGGDLACGCITAAPSLGKQPQMVFVHGGDKTESGVSFRIET